MNESTPLPPPLPPETGMTLASQSVPLGTHPDDTLEIRGGLGAIEAVLRHPRRIVFRLHQARPGKLIAVLIAISLVCALAYGLIVGSFSGGTQLWAAPAKIAVGMICAAFICLPSLYIFACLGGSLARPVEVVGAVAGLMTLTTLLLIGFAPVAWLFSESIDSVAAMGCLHLCFWIVAVSFGVRFLKTTFRHLGIRSESGVSVWVLIFLLVSVQMTTALRPLVGTSDDLLPHEKKFFITHWMENLREADARAPATPVESHDGRR